MVHRERCFYNEGMARGWESKSVESQMESAKSEDTAKSRQPLTEDDKKIERERQNLVLSRSYVLRQLESSSNEHYTESLRRALSDIDKKIAALDGAARR